MMCVYGNKICMLVHCAACSFSHVVVAVAVVVAAAVVVLVVVVAAFVLRIDIISRRS